MKLLVINGPNINFLGIREKGIYGEQNYDSLVEMIQEKAKELEIEVDIFQSNHEGEIIDRIQQAYFDQVDGIVINPGAFTHYSYAVRDALASIAAIPKIEVHISNVHTREEFRHTSVTVPVCSGQVVGLGLKGYLYAMEAIKDMCQ
jgi:3-dehydroquinate dehydratase-2